MRKEELQRLCRAAGLEGIGTIEALSSRLLEWADLEAAAGMAQCDAMCWGGRRMI